MVDRILEGSHRGFRVITGADLLKNALCRHEPLPCADSFSLDDRAF
jgi:hypothetical protein